MNDTRKLPQSEDAEKGVLGSILQQPAYALGICLQNELSPATFHHPAHSTLFQTLLDMRTEDRPIDLITVTDRLEATGKLNDVGGAGAVTDIFAFVPTATNIGYYIQILKEKEVLRMLIKAGEEYAFRAYEEQGEPEILVKEADVAFSKITEAMTRKTVVTRENLLAEYLQEKEDIATGKKKQELLPSPLPVINEKMGGFSAGEVTVIAGPTNSGKSLLGMEHVLLAVFDCQMPSAIFTGEMPYRQYLDRIMSRRAQIPSQLLRSAKLSGKEYRDFFALQDQLTRTPLEIYDSKRNKLTLSSIESEIRILKKKMGLKVVLIDYLQKLNLERRKDMRRDEEITAASSLFKSLAVELDLWFFVLSATNDDGQVRESRGPEFDADNILSVIIDQNSKRTEKIHITKCRDGEKGYLIDVEIIGEFCTFKQTAVPRI